MRLQRMSRWMRALVAAGAAGLLAATVCIFRDDSGLIEARVRELIGAAAPMLGPTLALGPGPRCSPSAHR